jgi:hypothetical protein
MNRVKNALWQSHADRPFYFADIQIAQGMVAALLDCPLCRRGAKGTEARL